ARLRTTSENARGAHVPPWWSGLLRTLNARKEFGELVRVPATATQKLFGNPKRDRDILCPQSPESQSGTVLSPMPVHRKLGTCLRCKSPLGRGGAKRQRSRSAGVGPFSTQNPPQGLTALAPPKRGLHGHFLLPITHR